MGTSKLNITVAGIGYVGLSIATLLARHNKVTAVDVSSAKVDMVNKRISPIQDDHIEKYFAEKELDLTATTDFQQGYTGADFVIVAAPTNYDVAKSFFDTSAVESVIDSVIAHNEKAVSDFKSGKEKALMALFGACMKELRGAGDPAVIKELLEKKLKA